MSTVVKLTLSDASYESAKQWAMIAQQDVSDTLTEVMNLLLSTVPSFPALRPVSSLPDNDLLALTTLQMDSQSGSRMNELLEMQREGELSYVELSELAALMQHYNQLWIRQSEALAEAVKRGLRNPLES